MKDEKGMMKRLIVWIVGIGIVLGVAGCATGGRHHGSMVRYEFPTVSTNHTHMIRLLDNAMGYLNPKHGLFDEASGYPCEGWNDDEQTGLRLRGFTQLTAIGAWAELLAEIAAGNARSPYVSRAEALRGLEQVVDSLLADQVDPGLSDRGLLCNFMGFEDGERVAPLASVVSKSEFHKAFGAEDGEAIWQALKRKGWLKAWHGDSGAEVIREVGYGVKGFNGELAVYDEPGKREKIMTVLNRRVVQIVYGDNANLAASAAKVQGALLAPALREQRAAKRIRVKLESFIEAQRPGYEFLYDARRGLFRFGWNASDRQYVGWAVDGGEWNAGYSDYLVNEFRGPTQFVVMRYGLPVDPLRNLGFWMKGRRMTTGEQVFTLAPWEGSAFQALGLSLFMKELTVPGWAGVLKNAVRVNLDYSRLHKLPGFLSESYTGTGIEYSGKVGVPDIAVDNKLRLTNSPSIYTLGVAYSILPDEIEGMLTERWTQVSTLFTPHGPWEGYVMDRGVPVECQTAAHVMSLILGCIGSGTVNMERYAEWKGMGGEWRRVYPQGERVDLLGAEAKAVVWSPDKGGVQGVMEEEGYRLWCAGRKTGAVTWTFPGRTDGVSPAGGQMVIRYRNDGAAVDATLSFEDRVSGSRNVANRIALRFAETGDSGDEIRIPLPATPGLAGVREIVLIGSPETDRGIDLVFRELGVVSVPHRD